MARKNIADEELADAAAGTDLTDGEVVTISNVKTITRGRQPKSKATAEQGKTAEAVEEFPDTFESNDVESFIDGEVFDTPIFAEGTAGARFLRSQSDEGEADDL